VREGGRHAGGGSRPRSNRRQGRAGGVSVPFNFRVTGVGGEPLGSVDFLEADGSGAMGNIPFLETLCSI
jgi:hypothetical protein